jgi:hypothetical protein
MEYRPSVRIWWEKRDHEFSYRQRDFCDSGETVGTYIWAFAVEEKSEDYR